MRLTVLETLAAARLVRMGFICSTATHIRPITAVSRKTPQMAARRPADRRT
jgi:hypothetical protein